MGYYPTGTYKCFCDGGAVAARRTMGWYPQARVVDAKMMQPPAHNGLTGG